MWMQAVDQMRMHAVDQMWMQAVDEMIDLWDSSALMMTFEVYAVSDTRHTDESLVCTVTSSGLLQIGHIQHISHTCRCRFRGLCARIVGTDDENELRAVFSQIDTAAEGYISWTGFAAYIAGWGLCHRPLSTDIV